MITLNVWKKAAAILFIAPVVVSFFFTGWILKQSNIAISTHDVEMLPVILILPISLLIAAGRMFLRYENSDKIIQFLSLIILAWGAICFILAVYKNPLTVGETLSFMGIYMLYMVTYYISRLKHEG